MKTIKTVIICLGRKADFVRMYYETEFIKHYNCANDILFTCVISLTLLEECVVKPEGICMVAICQ